MTGFLLRFILSAIFAMAFSVFLDDRIFGKRAGNNCGGTLPYFLLPLFMLMYLVIALLNFPFGMVVGSMMTNFFNIFVHIGIFYCILLIFMPVLRKYLKPSTTAALWIIPNYLYLTALAGFRTSEPLLSIKISGSWVKFIPYIWLLGFLIIFFYKIISHLVFRFKLLKNSEKVTDEKILKLWRDMQKNRGIKKANIPLYVSKSLKTPLSVGLFKRKIFVVLPSKDYTEKELDFIFTHELIHIVREDGGNKFFIMFATAACWFNPFMYLSMRRCSEDIELNCDEMALRYKEPSDRKEYAELILSSSGTEKGFTSCLSSSAKSLRFRLKSIMENREKSTGKVFACMVFFLLILTCGMVSLSLEYGSLEDILSDGKTEITSDIRTYEKEKPLKERSGLYEIKDEKALLDYLRNIKLYKLTGAYEYDSDNSKTMEFSFKNEGRGHIILSDGHITFHNYGEKTPFTEDYIFYEDLDWDYMLSLLNPKKEEKRIEAPILNLYYYDKDKRLDDEPMWPGREIVSITSGDGKEGSVPLYDEKSPSSVEGIFLTDVELVFPKIPESYTVDVYPLDNKDKITARYKGYELENNFLPIKEDSACVLDALFKFPDEGLTYRIKYYFNIDLP